VTTSKAGEPAKNHTPFFALGMLGLVAALCLGWISTDIRVLYPARVLGANVDVFGKEANLAFGATRFECACVSRRTARILSLRLAGELKVDLHRATLLSPTKAIGSLSNSSSLGTPLNGAGAVSFSRGEVYAIRHGYFPSVAIQKSSLCAAYGCGFVQQLLKALNGLA
tara:strand:- start:1740 stop:2243 length:504 start_codon:yes stop_codon:yes gene_type:complete